MLGALAHEFKNCKDGQAAVPKKSPGFEEEDEVVLMEGSGDEMQASGASTNTSQAEERHPLIGAVAGALPKFLRILNTVPNQTLSTTFGTEEPRLGPIRLATVQLVRELLKMGVDSVREAVLDSGLLNQVLELFAQFPHNSFLHLTVDDMVTYVIKETNEAFREKVLLQTQLLDRIAALAEEKTFSFSSGKQIRMPRMAFLTVMANKLNDAGAAQLADDGTKVKWKEYEEKDLKRANELNSQSLTGAKTRNLSETEEEENDFQFNMQKLFAKFSTHTDQKEENDKNDEEDLEREDPKEDEGEDASAMKYNLGQYDSNRQGQEHQNKWMDDNAADKGWDTFGSEGFVFDNETKPAEAAAAEDPGYYDNNYWHGSLQYTIEDLLVEFS